MNKKLKKTISLILCTIMLFGAAPLGGIAELDFSGIRFSLPFGTGASAEDEAINNITYDYNQSNNTLTITGEGDMPDYDSPSQTPWYNAAESAESVIFDGEITKIGANAFSGFSKLVFVAFPLTLSEIGEKAFKDCSSITVVDLPVSLVSVSDYAFLNCSKLSSIYIPANVGTIGEGAFRFCGGLNSINVSDDNSAYKSMNNCLVEISSQTLILGCNSSSIPSATITTFPQKYVTAIGDYAFANCSYLKSVNIPKNITSISSTAFYGCSGLESITADSQSFPFFQNQYKFYASNNCLIRKSDNTLILGCKNSVIPNDSDITIIGDFAFNGCTGLKSAIIPAGITAIGNYSFQNCSGLETLIFETSTNSLTHALNGVTIIKSYAFAGCTSLADVTIPDTVTNIESNAFEGVLNINYSGNMIASGSPWGAKLVNSYVEAPFAYSDNSKTNLLGSIAISDGVVSIPASVTSIGNKAFADCNWVKEVVFTGSNLSVIGDKSFFNCTKLYKITLPGSLISIGAEAFSGCTGIDYIFIPDGVTSIGTNAFLHVKAIKYNHVMTANGSPWGAESYKSSAGDNILWEYNEKTKTLYIFGVGEMYDYYSGSGINIPWENYRNDIEAVIIEAGVYNISDYAFFNCVNLKSISIPDTVGDISVYAFDGCLSLTEIRISGSNPNYSFSGNCLVDKKTGTLIKAIGNCIIPDDGSVLKIGPYAFSNITEISIPQSVTYIYPYAFENCNSLSDVYYSGRSDDWYNIDIINESPYFGNANLIDSAIHFSDGSVLKNGLFTYSVSSGNAVITGIKSNDYDKVVIPEKIGGYTVTGIASKAFENCTWMRSITISGNIQMIQLDSFKGCSGLETINFNAVNCSDYLYKTNITDLSEWLKITRSLESERTVNYLSEHTSHWLEDCKNLKTVNIGNNVKTVPALAFFSCDSLEEVSIGREVSLIKPGVFYNCFNLKTIHYNALNNTVKIYTVSELLNLLILNSSTNLLWFYSLGYELPWLGNCRNLQSVIIDDNVERIDSTAFNDVFNVSYSAGMTAVGSPWGARSENGYSEYPLNYTDNSKSVIVACAKYAEGDISVPSSVVTIKTQAFYSCVFISTVYIPSSVTSIGKDAFYLVNNIRYSDKMTAEGSPWGAKAFEAYIENGLTYYDDTKVVLTGCLPSAADSSGNVVIPDTVAEVGDNAFNGCDYVTSVTFRSAEIIDFSSTCFAGCDNLETVSSPNTDSDGITYMLDEPYAYHSAVTTGGARRAPAKAASSAGSGVDFNEFNGILFCDRSKSGEYSVPARIRYICENAFMNCVNLTVNLDNCDLRKIGRNAFMNSGNYNSWDKSGLFTIGNNIIGAASALSSLSVASSYRCIADFAFEICENLGSITISSSSIFIGKDAFKNTAYARDSSKWNGGALYIGNQFVKVSEDYSGPFTVNPGTVSIAAGAFSYCTGVTAVTLPDSIRDIGDSAFEYCFNLESVTLGGVETIGHYAFRDCSSLTDITIPAGVEKIGEFAFMNCTSLEGFNVAADNENYSSIDGVLFSKNGDSLIQYPAGRADIGIYDINAIDGCSRIESLAFGSCKNIGEIKMPPDNSKTVYFGYRNPFFRSSAKVNGSYLVIRGDKLVRWADDSPGAAFTVPDGIVKIGENAFAYCTNLKSITFNEGLTEIMNGAFFGCTGLESIVLPASVGKIERSAFENCENLKSVTFTNNNGSINDGLTSVGTCAFAGCADGIEFINREFLIKLGEVGPCAFGHEEEVKKEISPKSREATCTEDGFEYARVYCSACGKEHTDLDAEKILKATGHNVSTFTRNSSDTEKGVCSKCGETVLRPYNAGREADSPGVIEGRRKLESFFYSFIRRLLEFFTLGLIKIN